MNLRLRRGGRPKFTLKDLIKFSSAADKERPISMEFLKDLIGFIKARRKWWLLPVLFVLLITGLIIVFAGGSPFFPLIYPVF